MADAVVGAQIPLQDCGPQRPAAQQEGFAFCSRELRQKVMFLRGGQSDVSWVPLPFLHSQKVGDLNGTKWHIVNLLLDLMALCNMCILTTRITEAFSVNMLQIITSGFLKLCYSF